MNKPVQAMKVLVAHGWSLYFHPLFVQELESLTTQVEKLKTKHPNTYQQKNATKRLAAIEALVYDIIPQNPSRAEYRLGNSLGADYTHWFRAKFFQQYRLFFRYHAASKVIVYTWVNNEDSKRAYESDQDAYRVFSKMLQSGHPPNDWAQLLAAIEP